MKKILAINTPPSLLELPEECLLRILAHLDFKTLNQVSRTCKIFYRLAHDRQFAIRHLIKTYQDFSLQTQSFQNELISLREEIEAHRQYSKKFPLAYIYCFTACSTLSLAAIITLGIILSSEADNAIPFIIIPIAILLGLGLFAGLSYVSVRACFRHSPKIGTFFRGNEAVEQLNQISCHYKDLMHNYHKLFQEVYGNAINYPEDFVFEETLDAPEVDQLQEFLPLALEQANQVLTYLQRHQHLIGTIANTCRSKECGLHTFFKPSTSVVSHSRYALLDEDLAIEDDASNDINIIDDSHELPIEADIESGIVAEADKALVLKVTKSYFSKLYR